MALRDRLQQIKKWFLASSIRILILPYIIGIIWHGIHPIASIFTGDFSNPRRWYIDESSLEPSYFQTVLTYDLIQRTVYSYENDNIMMKIDSLCQGVNVYASFQNKRGSSIGAASLSQQGKIPCYRHDMQNRSSFEVVKIVPTSAGIVPTSEAIVLVIPPIEPYLHAYHLQRGSQTNGTKSRDQFQASVFQLIYRLVNQSPWLAKTVLIVAPIFEDSTPRFSSANHTLNPMLDQTVKDFLDSYLGRSVTPGQRLPMAWTGAMLRNLIVLDMETFPRDPPRQGEVRILPQGRNGVLPNMDLVFTVRTVYERSALFVSQPAPDQKKRKMNVLTVHPYRRQVDLIHDTLKEHGLPERLDSWVKKLLNLLAFEYVLALGPKPPHVTALDYGIDSLTLQASFLNAIDEDDYDERKGNRPPTKQSPQEYPREFVQRTEFIIRSLSNLHERLHHSTSLYLLTSSDRFVKHEEYLVPNLLLVVPLVIRALLILFRSDPIGVDFSAGFTILGGAAVWTWLYMQIHEGDSGHQSKPQRLLGIYIILIILAAHLFQKSCVKSMQFMACMAAAVVHVGLAFGHVSLSFLSALFWTPVFAFPQMYPTKDGVNLSSKVVTILQVIAAVASTPLIALLPSFFKNLTEYTQYAFAPLHFLLAISCISFSREVFFMENGVQVASESS